MNPDPAVRRILLGIALGLLLYLSWNGLAGGVGQLPQAQSRGQLVQTIAQLSYGLLAFLSAITTFWGRRWHAWILGAWTVCVTAAGGLAAVVWGGSSMASGLVAGVAALCIALAVVWLLRAGARGLRST